MIDKPAFFISGALAALIACAPDIGPLTAAVVWVVGYYGLKAHGRASTKQQRVIRAQGSSRRVRFNGGFEGIAPLNPTTGLPMVGNLIGGVDFGGHAWCEPLAINDYSADLGS